MEIVCKRFDAVSGNGLCQASECVSRDNLPRMILLDMGSNFVNCSRDLN